MIEIEASIHDPFSLEIKVGFKTDKVGKKREFDINTWMFIPNSLDINAATYSKQQFYSDVKSKVRFITPVFHFREIADHGAIPLNNLRASINLLEAKDEHLLEHIMEYEFQLKMFMAIFRSAIRDSIQEIRKNLYNDDVETLCLDYVKSLQDVIFHFRELKELVDKYAEGSDIVNYYSFSNEFLSYAAVDYTFHLLEVIAGIKSNLSSDVYDQLICEILKEKDYRRLHGFLDIQQGERENNQKIIYRNDMLNKYIESDLALVSNKRRDEDGVIAQQIYYSLAAGLSMIFATMIAFSFQQKYGNFTMPLFVALVISYMLKDRIKELMRFYFSGKLGGKYFDNNTVISVKDQKIGWMKEALDFIVEDKVSDEVLQLRDRSALLEVENRIHNEKVMLYRKKVCLENGKVLQESTYAFDGIHDIVRFNITRITQRMNNPFVSVYTLDKEDKDGVPNLILADKVYYLNIITQIKYEDKVEYRRFRLICQRSGIQKIEELL